MGQWTIPFGEVDVRQHHCLKNPASEIYSEGGITISTLLSDEVEWHGELWDGYAMPLDRIMELERESKHQCGLDNERLEHLYFGKHKQALRNEQMCRQELVSVSTGFCRI